MLVIRRKSGEIATTSTTFRGFLTGRCNVSKSVVTITSLDFVGVNNEPPASLAGYPEVHAALQMHGDLNVNLMDFFGCQELDLDDLDPIPDVVDNNDISDVAWYAFAHLQITGNPTTQSFE
jgi:hypothetical protein